MGNTTVGKLKMMIRINIINNNVVKTEDVNLATKYYGPYVGGIKGKTTRSRSTPVVSNIVEIPNEFLEVQQDLTVSMDIFTVHSLKFLSTISDELYYRTAKYFTKPVASVYDYCMEKLIAV